MQLWRANSYTQITHADPDFFWRLGRHLSVPVNSYAEAKKQTRFGEVYEHEGQWYASLLLGQRVPAGLTWHVQHLAQHYGRPCEVHDTRVEPEDYYPWFTVQTKPRVYQEDAHQQILKHRCGVINAPPRSGKTLMAVRAIDTLAQPTLYLAPSLAIVRQTYEVMKRHFGSDLVARLDGSAKPHEKDISKPVVVATAQSAVKQPKEWYDTRGMLIIDEFHHAASETYHRINALASNIHHRVCLTGTHFRTADDELAMQAICSNVLYQIPVPYLVQGGWLAPPRVVYVPCYGQSYAGTDWAKLYTKTIVECERRNEKVVFIARTLQQNGIPTLVLTKRRKHADDLGEMIPGSKVVKGGDNALLDRSIRDFQQGNVPTLIGTTVIGEGVDLPRACALIYASAGGASVQMLQSYFRPLTAAPGKTEGVIYDFTDQAHQTLKEHSRQRMRMAQQYLGNVEQL